MSTALREIENYEISMTGVAGGTNANVFLSFDVSDVPGVPHGATAAHLEVGDDGFGRLVVSFEDSQTMEEIAFPRCPPGLVETLGDFKSLNVAGLPSDGEEVLFLSSVRLTRV